MYEDRIEQARQNFLDGYNCTQSVVLAFADLYDLTPELALRISASFGGGMARMRLVCGTVSGMFLLAGLETGCQDPKDREGKTYNYQVVRDLANRFQEKVGSLICAEILGLKGAERSAMPSERTQEYYKKRPCADIVKTAARIFADFLENEKLKEK